MKIGWVERHCGREGLEPGQYQVVEVNRVCGKYHTSIPGTRTVSILSSNCLSPAEMYEESGQVKFKTDTIDPEKRHRRFSALTENVTVLVHFKWKGQATKPFGRSSHCMMRRPEASRDRSIA